jgi:hypothetical protein
MINESSLERAERIKVACNLDFKGNKADAQPSFLHFSNDAVMSNLGAVEISFGQNHSTID